MMKSQITAAFNRAKYAAVGAAVGAALGGLVSRQGASTGGAVGGLVGATASELCCSNEGVYSNIKQKIGSDE